MIYGYPQPGKSKSIHVLQAFLRGAGGCFSMFESRLEADGDGAAFYGIKGIENLFRQARARMDVYYLDNAFLDAARGTHFRVGVNALQGPLCNADYGRLAALGVSVKSWTRAGRHIVLCPQSDYFMRELADWRGGAAGWQEQVMATLARHTDRPIVARPWSADKIALGKTLAQDLEGAWALVTHSSAAAIAAILAGVPAFMTGPGVALEMASSELELIERPRRPDGTREWAARLAASQWTLEEMRAGLAWRALGREKVAA